MKKNEWIIVIILMIVIAAVVAYITGSITGNVIKLNQDRWGKYNAYTKEEIDTFITEIDDTITRIYTMIDERTTNQKVLDMLNECVQVEPNQTLNRWCGATCKTLNKETIGFSTYVSYVALKRDGQRDLHQVPLFGWGDSQPMPSCGTETNIGCGLAGNAEELMEIETGFNTTTTTISEVGVYSRCICC